MNKKSVICFILIIFAAVVISQSATDSGYSTLQQSAAQYSLRLTKSFSGIPINEVLKVMWQYSYWGLYPPYIDALDRIKVVMQNGDIYAFDLNTEKMMKLPSIPIVRYSRIKMAGSPQMEYYFYSSDIGVYEDRHTYNKSYICRLGENDVLIELKTPEPFNYFDFTSDGTIDVQSEGMQVTPVLFIENFILVCKVTDIKETKDDISDVKLEYYGLFVKPDGTTKKVEVEEALTFLNSRHPGFWIGIRGKNNRYSSAMYYGPHAIDDFVTHCAFDDDDNLYINTSYVVVPSALKYGYVHWDGISEKYEYIGMSRGYSNGVLVDFFHRDIIDFEGNAWSLAFMPSYIVLDKPIYPDHEDAYPYNNNVLVYYDGRTDNYKTPPKEGIVLDDGLRVRLRSNTNSMILATLKKGDQVRILKTGIKEKINGITGNWLKITIKGGITGWAFGGYIKIKE